VSTPISLSSSIHNGNTPAFFSRLKARSLSGSTSVRQILIGLPCSGRLTSSPCCCRLRISSSTYSSQEFISTDRKSSCFRIGLIGLYPVPDRDRQGGHRRFRCQLRCESHRHRWRTPCRKRRCGSWNRGARSGSQHHRGSQQVGKFGCYCTRQSPLRVN